MLIDHFIEDFSKTFSDLSTSEPWNITNDLKNTIEKMILNLGDDYIIQDNIAIHKSATIENNVTIKKPAIIGENCYIGANAYFREGVYLDQSVKIGPGCEIKNSIICSGTAIAHFNYIGNSIIGRNINFEAGSIAANHYNERANKKISVLYDNKIIETNSDKFGSLVGDNSRIGANAVLSPGTILVKNSIVKRLELVEQVVPE
ncbi:Bifunctional protein GlmU [Flavobacterium bizetiae]|uniref:Bifunctional protein GlmU n=1 Tax=Flavobacterium bizetiae TaxID=2704140 RepID=A0A6J4GBN0_9FLAO|nr:DapH/DapD/GlmU-related protein [Flavobacterium bizetiae]CAA9195430.1 Bifunctional protein GlmU [Flavobacterium bizetiae]CAD5340359.1 Bifunctional protein GlmU [Flavobacterium bizetiae]CAD5346522.1 Bifunctional protein GlmU [Flavobacterium bizetiae]